MIDIDSLDFSSLPVSPREWSIAPDADDSEPVDPKQVCPFKVVIDTREQAPFHFLNCDPWSIVPTVEQALPTGDYSIAGHESSVTIERKSISDFLGSISADRDRFEREFERMAEMKFAAVAIEGQLSDVLVHARENTRLLGRSITGTVNSWSVRYGVHFVFCLSRRHAELTTLALLNAFWKELKTE